jgi:hypothetical protein
MSTLLPGKMILTKTLNFLCGDLTRRTMLLVLVPLILASYFGILCVASLLSPESYDWRYNSISQLLYARDNPEFHYIASISVAGFGVLMIPFAGYIRRRLRGAAPTASMAGAVVFFAGCICLTLAGLITSHPAHGMTRFPKLHDILARLSAINIGVGMVVFNVCGTKGYFRPKPGKPLHQRSLLVSWNLLTLPLVFIVVTWLVIRTYLKQSGPTYHAVVTSAAWKVGLWEWIGLPVVFLFLFCAVLFLPKKGIES